VTNAFSIGGGTSHDPVRTNLSLNTQVPGRHGYGFHIIGYALVIAVLRERRVLIELICERCDSRKLDVVRNVDGVAYDLSDSVNLVRGTHQMSFGGDLGQGRSNTFAHVNSTGGYTFSGQWAAWTIRGRITLEATRVVDCPSTQVVIHLHGIFTPDTVR
jgi:hypothetical protein